MSFKDKYCQAEAMGKKVYYTGISVTAIWAIVGIFLRVYNLNSEINLLSWTLFCFIGYWIYYKRYQENIVINCENCNFKLDGTILSLTKDNEFGYCPQCGKEID